jgi:hypothetical protein
MSNLSQGMTTLESSFTKSGAFLAEIVCTGELSRFWSWTPDGLRRERCAIVAADSIGYFAMHHSVCTRRSPSRGLEGGFRLAERRPDRRRESARPTSNIIGILIGVGEGQTPGSNQASPHHIGHERDKLDAPLLRPVERAPRMNNCLSKSGNRRSSLWSNLELCTS